MFHLNSPEILEVLRNSGFVNSEKLSRIQGKGTVIVSVIGCSDFHEEQTYKRAFRLIIDSFGSPRLFKNNSTNSTSTSSEAVSALSDGDIRSGGNNAESGSKVQRPLGSIDGFFTEEENVLFLHLQGAYDPQTLLAEWVQIKASMDTSEMGFSQIWAGIKSKYCRSLLLLFSLSHVVLVSSTGSFFDTSYIHFFRILDTVRHEVLPFVSKLLSKIEGIPKAWKDHGRLCSPRILFMFQIDSGRPIRAPTELPIEDPVKDLQFKLEDEIYHALRKCRIVTNISANSLFAIPSSQEYVFLYDRGVQEPEMQDEPLSRLNHITSVFCDRMSAAMLDTSSADYKNVTKLCFSNMFPSTHAANAMKKPGEQLRTYKDLLEDFHEFITSHTRLALDSGFDDDSKHVAEHKHFFVLPTFEVWRRAFETLNNYLVCESHSDYRAKDALALIHQFNNVDTEYLESQCAKMFPKVYALYLKNLPEIYPEKIHKAKVSQAIDAFLKVTRGPGVRPWVNKLIEKCDRYWKRGHEQCEARSLHEHTCSHPLHRVRIEDHLEVIPLVLMDESLPEMEHCTGHRIISYCNCGHRQGSRDEPFTIREANFAFYERLGQDCCDRLDSVPFPSYIPPAGHEKSTIHPQEMLLIYQQKLMGLLAHHQENYEPVSDEVEDELRQEDDSLSFDNDESENDNPTLQQVQPQPQVEEVKPVEVIPGKLAPDTVRRNIWNKAPIETDLLPRTELENEYIYNRIRERKALEGPAGEAESRTEYQIQVRELADQLKADFRKGDDDRKEWMKWSGYEYKPPEFFDARAMKETLYKSFDSPMKTMALSMRFKEGWEQRSKRLPQHIVSWVNEYTSRRRFINDPEESLAVTLDDEDGHNLLVENPPIMFGDPPESGLPLPLVNHQDIPLVPSVDTQQSGGQFSLPMEISHQPPPAPAAAVQLAQQEPLSVQFKKLVLSSVEPREAPRVPVEEQPELPVPPVQDNVSGNRSQEIDDVSQESASESDSKDMEVRGETPTGSQDDISMQYLPGMMHSRSLRGLLPLFPSWSLVCLGSSSLYTHSVGITHQPGFLNGSSTLLPWDKMVKAESGVTKPIPRLIRGRKPTGRAKRITDEFNVKVFIGIEYECKRGHRFLLESPTKILQILGQHGPPNLKEAANAVVGSDMPLYYRCPCKENRDGSAMIAQLMRVHVVTPKAPVHVTINPRVQPGPSPCPIFYPGAKDPMKLTPSSYWILRLPYCYVGDDQVYVPSKDVIRYNGRLLKGLVDVESMTPAETKVWEAQQNAT